MAQKIVQTQNDAAESGFDYRWHLAQSAAEVEATELEFALMRTFEGFGRWQSECLAGVCDLAATGPENALLHIIRMNERPKTMKDLARLTNRDDVPNMQYSLRKLIGDEGRRGTDDFGALRRRLLLAEIASLPGFSARLAEAARALNVLSGIYEEVARVAATHRRG